MIDLRHGLYWEALADVHHVDAVITDPPYSEYTHAKKNGNEVRQGLAYEPWRDDDVRAFVGFWTDRCTGWIGCITDDVLAPIYKRAFDACDRVTFAPVPLLAHQPRFSGDGPGSGAVYLVVSRPRAKSFSQWGSLPGWYHYVRESSSTGVIGAKPVDLMRAIVRDYSQPGDLVCDPCAGGGTTLIAARIEGRRAIGSERDHDTYEKASTRITLGDHAVRFPEQASLFGSEETGS